MSNSMFEQYGYKSARDLMSDLARDISDGGELIPAWCSKVEKCYKFNDEYWIITYNHGEVISLEYLETEN